MILKSIRLFIISWAIYSVNVAMAMPTITVDIYQGKTASVNSYIFSNGKSLIVMDVQRSSAEAKKLATKIKNIGLPLSYILVSHGHPDHYIGMDILLKTFPKAKVIVANEEIKNDIANFSSWMESVNWLDAEPNLKPKSDNNPTGFDYSKNIHVLDGGFVEFNEGGRLTLNTHYLPAEAEHVTTVYVEGLGLFASDLGYNKVHLWMGQGVTTEHIKNWKSQLKAFRAEYNSGSLVVYPGHGEPSNIHLFDKMIDYINNFQNAIVNSESKQQAIQTMVNLYPDYKEADFLLKYSVDFHYKNK